MAAANERQRRLRRAEHPHISRARRARGQSAGVGLRNMVNQLGQAPAAVANETYRPDDEGEY